MNAFVNGYVGLMLLIIPVSISEGRGDLSRYVFPLCYTLQHIITEGVAFMLMQKGCGVEAASRAFQYSFIWGIITYFLVQMWHSSDDSTSIVVRIIWSGTLAIFFFSFGSFRCHVCML